MVAPVPINEPSAAFQRQVAQDALQRGQTGGQRGGEGLTAEIAERAQQNPGRATDVSRPERPADPTNRADTPTDRRNAADRQDRIEIRPAESNQQPAQDAEQPAEAASARSLREAAAASGAVESASTTGTSQGGIAPDVPDGADRPADDPRTSADSETGTNQGDTTEQPDVGEQRVTTAQRGSDAQSQSDAQPTEVAGGDSGRPETATDGADAETRRAADELAGTLSILNGATTSGSLVNIAI